MANFIRVMIGQSSSSRVFDWSLFSTSADFHPPEIVVSRSLEVAKISCVGFSGLRVLVWGSPRVRD